MTLENRFTKLPEPVRPELMRAAHDVESIHDDLDDEYREVQWMLRSGGF